MYPGKWAKETPNKPAVIDTRDDTVRTYQELDDRSNRFARYLWNMGLRKGDHIAVLMENNLTYLDVAWAALRSGLYLTPINRYFTTEEAAYIVNDSGARVLVSSSALAEIAEALPQRAPNCERFLAVGNEIGGYEEFEDAIAQFQPVPLEQQPAGEFMNYSSGTTGKPKGVMRPLPDRTIDAPGNMLALLQSQLWGVDTHTVYLSPAPLYHSAPIVSCVTVHALGGTVVIMPKFDERAALAAIEKWRVTHSQWVPTMFTRMLKLPKEARLGWDLSSHRVAVHAAAPCPREVKQQMFDWWGPILYEYYAGSEINGLTHAGPQEWLEHPGTVGRAILGTLHICDDEGNELPTGESGNIYFELPVLPFQYLKDPEKTRESQHPKHPNWSTLGDVGYLDEDGFLYLTDRATFMIVSGGVNIYPQEIEDAMIMHPSVEDVAVIGVPNADMGEEVKAIVQVRPGVIADCALEDELIAYLRERIAHYKCPRSVDFIDEMPRQPTGKLFKRLLKDKYWGASGSRIV